MQLITPKELKDARINEVFVESDSRILLHLRDGRAVAIDADHQQAPAFAAKLTLEVVNTA